MSDVVIRVENLGKEYRLGQRESYHTFRDTLAAFAMKPWKKWRASTADSVEDKRTFWALRDVCFEVAQGDVVGIIGRNGAGKSTLLKILSQITEPTAGSVELTGRVGSLLEVGTGFHPELTGRENIFLNGAILGMKRTEIIRDFDEIVAFAEVEDFIDTPVKHYSSGMYMRLAFAVAAHLEPEILIVDEVLAVGDAEFQKKCIGKMGQVAKGGRTVLFVSHNMGMIQRICTNGLVLEHGRVAHHGSLQSAVAKYLGMLNMADGDKERFELRSGPQSHGFELTGLRINRIDGGEGTGPLCLGEPFDITIEFTTTGPMHGLTFGIEILTQEHVLIFATHSDDTGPTWDVDVGHYSARVRVDPNHLAPGKYFLNVAAWRQHGTLAVVGLAGSLNVCDVQYGRGFKDFGKRPGYLYVPLTWVREAQAPLAQVAAPAAEQAQAFQ